MSDNKLRKFWWRRSANHAWEVVDVLGMPGEGWGEYGPEVVAPHKEEPLPPKPKSWRSIAVCQTLFASVTSSARMSPMIPTVATNKRRRFAIF